MNVQMQLASSLFLVLIILNYIHNRKVRTKTSRIFLAMIVVSCIYMIFDFVTVFMLTNYRFIPEIIVDYAHIGFYVAIQSYVFLIYLYMDSIIVKRWEINRWLKALSFLPMIISIISVWSFPINYNVKNHVYSYGIGVNILFGVIAFYIGLSTILILVNWNRTEKKKRVAVLVSAIIMAVACVLQLLFPGLLLSGTAVVLTLMCFFLSQENPIVYLDIETGAMNNHAFKLVLHEKFRKKELFSTVTVVFDDWSMLTTSLGYRVGRKLIRAVTDYMQQIYGMDVYYPMTGAPSLICDRQVAMSVARQLGEKLDALNEIDGLDLDLHWHICIADYPKHGEHASDVESNISFFATHSAEQEEAEGENHIILYDEKWAEMLKRESVIEQILKDAIVHDGLEMYYQPIYATKEKCFHSAEALVRLKDTKTLGFISPEEFIPLAERKGLIVDMSMLIFEKVCRFIYEGNLEELGIQYIEVNLSAVHCMDSRLVPQLTGLMKRYHIRPEQLNLEITETTAISVNKYLESNLSRLLDMGCGFSMDDYGTGYSNLSQIADLTFDLAKLDKSLVWGYFEENATKEKVILSSTVDMFQKLDMELVAEGVETKEQADELARMGVEYLQGYYFSRPIPPGDFLVFLHKNRAIA